MAETDDGSGPEPADLDSPPDGLPPPVRVGNLDTLAAADALPNADLDDRLMHRELKSRIFGSSSAPVQIGRYAVLRRIGLGGMGSVYLAHDPELDRNVALKILRVDRKSGQERMLNEARALAKLSHPNVVTVHEVGVHDDRVFVAMEFVAGQTLREWICQQPSRNELFRVFSQAAHGLAAVHAAGLVHRDFKPDNVVIGVDGRVRVVDFGVVKTTDTIDDASGDAELQAAHSQSGFGGTMDLTRTGQLLGTPAYMAAEQFLGERTDARTDVFAFCVALYESLAGARPFSGDEPGEVARAVLTQSAAPLPHDSTVPHTLVTLIERGLSRSPDARPSGMQPFIGALDYAARPVGATDGISRTRAIAAILAVTGILFGSGILMFSVLNAEAEQERAESIAATTSPPDNSGPQHEGFAAFVAAHDDKTRQEQGEAFLEQHGDHASDVQLAIVHSALGDIQWRQSCPEAQLGLCLTRDTAAVDPASTCDASTLTPAQRVGRDTALATSARKHLDEVVARAAVEAPDDADLARLFRQATARAQVQRTDDTLEELLELRPPQGLDFDHATTLSSDALRLYINQVTQRVSAVVKDYAAVKRSNDAQWTVTAAARTAVAYQLPLGQLARQIPNHLDAAQHETYCAKLDTVALARLRKQERTVLEYCVTRSNALRRPTPEAVMCKERLRALNRTP